MVARRLGQVKRKWTWRLLGHCRTHLSTSMLPLDTTCRHRPEPTLSHPFSPLQHRQALPPRPAARRTWYKTAPVSQPVARNDARNRHVDAARCHEATELTRKQQAARADTPVPGPCRHAFRGGGGARQGQRLAFVHRRLQQCSHMR
eukprot:scaffold13983_cov125-Isochrysis_galbana.AAC.13